MIEDAVAREGQRVERFPGARFGRGLHLIGADPDPEFSQIYGVELFRQLDHRGIAAAAHVGNDAGDRAVDIGRNFALQAEQPRKVGGERRVLTAEAHGHELNSGVTAPALI